MPFAKLLSRAIKFQTTAKSSELQSQNRVANILIVDLENFTFNTLKPILELEAIDFKTVNQAIREIKLNSEKTTSNSATGQIIEKTISSYIDTLATSLTDLIGAVGKKLKLLMGYGYISLAIFVAKSPNKPVFEAVRKTLTEKLKNLGKNVLVVFLYGSSQPETDDYLLEGVVEDLLRSKKGRENLLKKYLKYESLPEGLKHEWEKILNYQPNIVVVTKDRRLKKRLQEKYQKDEWLILSEANLNPELLEVLNKLAKIDKLTVVDFN